MEFTVTLGRALVAGETIDVPLSISGAGVSTSDWSLARKTGAGLNTGVTLSGQSTATLQVRFSGAGAQTATLELTPADDGVTEGTETFTIALGPDGGGANGFDRGSRGTNVGGGADPHGMNNDFDLVVVPLVKPTSFSTTAGNAQVTLAWNNPDTGASITKWQYQQKAGGGSYGSWTTISGCGASTTSHTVTGLVNGTVYAFRIRAVAGATNGPQLDEATATPKPLSTITISTESVGVTEGESVPFTLSASPAPIAALTVKLSDGSKYVVPANQGSKDFSLATVDDDQAGQISVLSVSVVDDDDDGDGVTTISTIRVRSR